MSLHIVRDRAVSLTGWSSRLTLSRIIIIRPNCGHLFLRQHSIDIGVIYCPFNLHKAHSGWVISCSTSDCQRISEIFPWGTAWDGTDYIGIIDHNNDGSSCSVTFDKDEAQGAILHVICTVLLSYAVGLTGYIKGHLNVSRLGLG